MVWGEQPNISFVYTERKRETHGNQIRVLCDQHGGVHRAEPRAAGNRGGGEEQRGQVQPDQQPVQKKSAGKNQRHARQNPSDQSVSVERSLPPGGSAGVRLREGGQKRKASLGRDDGKVLPEYPATAPDLASGGHPPRAHPR